MNIELAVAAMNKFARWPPWGSSSPALPSPPKPGPTAQEMEILRAIVDESKKAGVLVQVHAVSPPAMMAAVDAGVPLLVNTPHFGWLTRDEAKRVSTAGIKQLSTIGFGVPVFGVFADDKKPRWRGVA